MLNETAKILESLIDIKLKLSEALVQYLPIAVQPVAEDIRIEVLSAVRNSIDRGLKGGPKTKESSFLKKIDLE